MSNVIPHPANLSIDGLLLLKAQIECSLKQLRQAEEQMASIMTLLPMEESIELMPHREAIQEAIEARAWDLNQLKQDVEERLESNSEG